MPLILALIVPPSWIIAVVSLGSLAFLGTLGALGARVGGAPMGKGAVLVVFWGAVALAATAAIGHLFGAAV